MKGELGKIGMTRESTEMNDVVGHHLLDHEAVTGTEIVKDTGRQITIAEVEVRAHGEKDRLTMVDHRAERS